MKDAPKGVLIAGDQTEETAKKDFEELVSKVAAGEVKGIVLLDEGMAGDEALPLGLKTTHRVRRGATYGAGVGFVVGLVPLLASTFIAAAVGGLIAKGSELRVERGTAPRLRFGKRDTSN